MTHTLDLYVLTAKVEACSWKKERKENGVVMVMVMVIIKTK
jgi:hypothetical protein